MLNAAHVLMTTDTVGGVWSYSVELAHELANHGVRVTLASMGAPVSASQRAQVAALPSVALHESSFRLEWMDQPWADVDAAGEWLLSLESKLRPDVVHLNGFAHGALPFRAPQIVVAHSDVLSWFEAVRGTDAPESWRKYRERVRAGLLAAKFVVAISGAVADSIGRHYDVPPPTVIHNGVASQGYSCGPKEDLVLGSGRAWDEAKNLLTLDAAAGVISWPVYIAGATESPNGNAVTFRHAQPLGFVAAHNLRDWYSRASVYALPAVYEPFGLTILEAALSGCALVLGDIPSLRELWARAATFVPPRDVSAIASAIESLAARPRIVREMGRRAYERARCFTAKKMAACYLELYRQLLNTTHTREVFSACES